MVSMVSMVIRREKSWKWVGRRGKGGMRLVSEGKATNPGYIFIVGEFDLSSVQNEFFGKETKLLGHSPEPRNVCCEKFNPQRGSSGLNAIKRTHIEAKVKKILINLIKSS